jgi:hypothetical protein
LCFVDDDEDGGSDNADDDDDGKESEPAESTAGFTPIAASALLSNRATSTFTLHNACSERKRPL